MRQEPFGPYEQSAAQQDASLYPAATGELAQRTWSSRMPQPVAPQTGNEMGQQATKVLHAIQKWWRVCIPVGLLLASIAGTVVWMMFVPMYEAKTTLLIKSEAPYIAFRNNQDSKGFAATHMAFLGSERILQESLQELASIPQIKKQSDPVVWLQKHLTVSRLGASDLYEVRFASAIPEESQRIVTAIVNSYLEFVKHFDHEEDKELLRHLADQQEAHEQSLNQLREQLRVKIQRVKGYDPYFSWTDLDASNSPIVLYQTQAIDAESKLAMAVAELDARKNGIGVSNNIDAVELDQRVHEHPEIVGIMKSIAKTREQLADAQYALRGSAMDKSVARLESKLERDEKMLEEAMMRVREDTRTVMLERSTMQNSERIKELEATVETLRETSKLMKGMVKQELDKLGIDGESALELEFLKADLHFETGVYNMISERLVELQTERHAPQRISLYQAATMPTRPVEVAPWNKLFAAACVCFVIPFGLAVAWEQGIQRINDVSQLKKSHLQVLGEIAVLPTAAGGGQRSDDRAKRELSLFEESVDSLRTGVHLTESLENARVLAVTSAVSREGKTSLSSQFAVSIARASGEKTLLIDADMRSPDISEVFQVSNERGLAEVLSGECTPQDAIVSNFNEFLHLLPAGVLSSSPHRLVGNGAFERLIQELRHEYRYIIIDTPPVLSASEALVFAKAADASLVCARRNFSRNSQVRQAFDRLQYAGANAVGVVLNGVPARRYYYKYGRYAYPR